MSQQLPCCMGYEVGKASPWPHCLGAGRGVQCVGRCRLQGSQKWLCCPGDRGLLLLGSTGVRQRRIQLCYHCLRSFSFAGFSLISMSNLAKQLRAKAPPEKLDSILMHFRGLPFDYLTLLLEGEIFFRDSGIIQIDWVNTSASRQALCRQGNDGSLSVLPCSQLR